MHEIPVGFSSQEILLRMKILAVRHIDDDIRKASSSGGVFHSLASWVLRQGGKVIGAAYGDTAYEVKHIVVDQMDNLYKLQKSKYAPSSMSDHGIREVLEGSMDTWVLFSGTPCQIKAVHNRYGHSQKLIFVEVACHGVPNREAYQTFLKENDIVKIDFRCKRNGWKNTEIEMTHSDGSISYQRSVDNSFYQDYVSGKNLRKSCFSCPAKYFRSGADFTLADFWGVESFVPELNDDNGVSLVFLHTKTARRIWDEISSSFISKSVSFYEATHWNQCIYRPIDSTSTIREAMEEKKYIIKQYLKRLKLSK